ncbi:MAG TPA: hypothetical protein VHJ58_04250 [Vicinamibacterales bacterium]|nr:hypothetical protein [Vicinamibacterales bacterium]
MTADTPILEHVPTVGLFTCHVKGCDQTSEWGIYEPVPSLQMTDYWPTCPCGARLHLESVYEQKP